jgi:hypothetical protein
MGDVRNYLSNGGRPASRRIWYIFLKIGDIGKVGWAKLFRVATHLAAWAPFVITVAVSARGPWRVVGDGATIALRAWDTAVHVPLVGQSTELGHGLHDPGPLLYWLLAIPVHIDPVRGVLWGAAVCCMAAASLAIEAAWSVLGTIGGVAAGGAILGMIAWRPGVAVMPYWNPWFGAMFFLAAIAACWAVMSGRRWWWPVLVVTASVAAQAHLMFTLASAAVVLVALITGLADAAGAGRGYQWAVTGLAAGVGCWAAPFIQQLTGRHGNLAALLTQQGGGRRTGLGFALNTLTAATRPPPLWWPLPRLHLLHVTQLLAGGTAVFAVAVLTATAAALFAALFLLRSRPLAAIAVISLLDSAAALVTFSQIPVSQDSLSRVFYLAAAMFPAGLLIWFTIGSALMITGRRLIRWIQRPATRRAQPPGWQRGLTSRCPRLVSHVAGATTVALIVLAAVPGAMQPKPGFPGDARRAGLVAAADRLINGALRAQPVTLSVLAASKPDRHRLRVGLMWALTGDGYRVERHARSGRRRPVPHVTVLILDGKITTVISGDASHALAEQHAVRFAAGYPPGAGRRGSGCARGAAPRGGG